MDHRLREKIETELAVPLWPDAGMALGSGRNATYRAFANGQIPGAYRIGNKILVATAPLRRFLGIEPAMEPHRDVTKISRIQCDSRPDGQ
jgi:hypothetical protein